MNLRALLCCVPMLACGASPQRIVVRVAAEGEVLEVLPKRPPLPPGRRWNFMRCQVRGRPASEVIEPVVRFARHNLVRDLVYPELPVRLQVIGPGIKSPKLRRGIELTVDPRSVVGSLRLSIKRGQWDSGIYYCLHVLRDHDTTTVVVQKAFSWIK